FFPISFFFHAHRHLRDLHSFPTRRSSDLIDVRQCRDRIGRRAGIDQLTERRIHASEIAVGRLRAPEDVSVIEEVETLQPEQNRTDRKSTRLNSSHVSISYAVFCLKKKK